MPKLTNGARKLTKAACFGNEFCGGETGITGGGVWDGIGAGVFMFVAGV